MADKNQNKGYVKNSKLNEYKKQEFNAIKNLEDETEEKVKPEITSKQNQKIDKDSNSSISISSSSYKNSIQNLENLKKIKEDLKINNENTNNFNCIYEQMDKEETKLIKLYEKEDKVNEERIEKNFIMDDNIFKNRIIKILCDVYDLKEYISYPYFTVEYSYEIKSNIVKIYYYQIDIESNEEIFPYKNNKIELDKKNVERFLFLDDRKTYMICYKEMPMIFQKNKGLFYSVNIISKDFESSEEFFFQRKNSKEFITTIIMADINKELLKIKGEMIKTKNEIDSLENNEKRKKELNVKLAKLNNTYNFLKKKYSKQNIEEELKKKKEDLDDYEEKIKVENSKQEKDEKNIKEYENKIKNIQTDIKSCEMLLSPITIKIEKKEQEFDGLFFSTKEIKLENSIGDSLTIHPQSPIIIEVKNIISYNTIINSIRAKKKTLDSLKLNENNFYFIGIIRNIDIDEKKMKKINEKMKSLDFNNMIVIAPDGLNFLGVPLYEKKTKTEVKNGNNLEDKLNLIIEKLEKMHLDINELKNRVKTIEENNINKNRLVCNKK